MDEAAAALQETAAAFGELGRWQDENAALSHLGSALAIVLRGRADAAMRAERFDGAATWYEQAALAFRAIGAAHDTGPTLNRLIRDLPHRGDDAVLRADARSRFQRRLRGMERPAIGVDGSGRVGLDCRAWFSTERLGGEPVAQAASIGGSRRG